MNRIYLVHHETSCKSCPRNATKHFLTAIRKFPCQHEPRVIPSREGEDLEVTTTRDSRDAMRVPFSRSC